MKKKRLLFSLIFLTLFLVGALQIITFSNDLSSENITFSGNENHSRNLTIYRYANVTSATMNLSGYGNDRWDLFKKYSLSFNGYGLSSNVSNFIETLGTPTMFFLYPNGTSTGKTFVKSGLYYTRGVTNNGTSIWVVEDYTSDYLYEFYINGTWTGNSYDISAYVGNVMGITNDGTYLYIVDTSDKKINIFYMNGTYVDEFYVGDVIINPKGIDYYDESLWITGNNFNGRVYNYSIVGIYSNYSSNLLSNGNGDPYGITNNGTMFFVIDRQDTSMYAYYSEDIYINNASLSMNGTNIWNYNGEFNQSNNQTNDFSTTLNIALNSGNCDCVGCSLSGNNCTIPFTFHSDTAGNISYSDININWLEYTSPNSTIIQPTGTKTTIDSISYNITTEEDWERDTCIYWITRGASTEIANNTLTCSDEITGLFSVSTDRANYVYHFWMNDTSGNINYTNSSFYVEIPSGSPEGGGGSSGSSVTIEGDKGWIMQVADGVEKYEIQMSKDSTRELEIQFENIGETERTIRLDCEDIEGEICEYITFEEDTFTLPVKKDLTTRIPFEIKLPELLEEKEYVFNIKATDDNFVDGSISVYLGVGKAGLLITTLSKLRQGFYFLIFSVIFLFCIFVFAFALPKKFPIKPFFVIIFSMTLAFLGIYFT